MLLRLKLTNNYKFHFPPRPISVSNLSIVFCSSSVLVAVSSFLTSPAPSPVSLTPLSSTSSVHISSIQPISKTE